MKLKDRVERILQLFPDSRNSDVTLMIHLWKRYFNEKIIHSKDGKEQAINLKSLYDLPREDHIKRWRAKFQNDRLKYLPTSWEVAKQRRINEGVWRAEMGDGRTLPML